MSMGPIPNIAGGLSAGAQCVGACGTGRGGGGSGGGGYGGGFFGDGCSSCGGADGPSCDCGQGQCPPPPPTGPYAQNIFVGAVSGPPLLKNLRVTCKNTGVSQDSICGSVTFYHETSGTKTYDTPGGACQDCIFVPNNFTAGSGSNSGPVPIDLTIFVTIS